ncbi:hypothetical protein H0H92_014827 [Tricholoma furcatifolium]|nr:hypothetical protein H0H92_014827 [Tricholoma furcatifolium]
MAYTSSALSFMLEDLGKTVILTGAQIPMSQLRNDAVDNFMGALTIAGHYIIPECSVYFNHRLYRGNRTSKMSSYDLHAFASPNFPPLVDGTCAVGIDIVVNWNNVLRQTEMSPHVATLRLFPGITAATVRAFFMPPIRGVVLETFGAGNAPQRADLMQALKEACDRGVIVVAITQCSKGSVSDAYETGRTLLQAGVVPGNDMTPEPELSVTEIRELMATSLRGELTGSSHSTIVSPDPASIEKTFASIQGVLSQFIRLTQPPTSAPQIVVTPETLAVDGTARDVTAPWTMTIGEAATTEAVLIPFLIHLAAARNDITTMRFCIDSYGGKDGAEEPHKSVNVSGGIVNCLAATNGQTPLHAACLNGSAEAVDLLLHSGALVHLRDSLGHTALYYVRVVRALLNRHLTNTITQAARQGHKGIVDELLQAGATLGGVDEPFAVLGLKSAVLTRDEKNRRIWEAIGVKSTSINRVHSSDPVALPKP